MKNAKDSRPKQAVVFELENVAANGHAVLYSVVKEALGRKNVEVSPAVFARFCLNSTVDKFLARLLSELGKAQLASEGMAEEIRKNYLTALTAKGNQTPPVLRAIIEKAAGMHVAAGALSCLSGDAAQRLAEHLGLNTLGVTVRTRNSEYGSCVTRDEWVKLTASMSAQPMASVAIASTSEACKSALAAGMKVIACPGRHAGFGDFGGVDAMVDTLDNATATLVFSLLEPHSWA
jgi:beta-phosphoglucomutase-like phosphatase (HAD superfamily)